MIPPHIHQTDQANPFRFPKQSISGSNKLAFTLYELLAVLAIISIVASLSFASLSSLLVTQNVNQAVNVVCGTAQQARQLAITSGNPVALIVSGTAGEGSDSQAVLLLKGDKNQQGGIAWLAEAGGWNRLPKGVNITPIERDGNSSFYSSADTQSPLTGELPLGLGGASILEYTCVVFRPDGSIDSKEGAPGLTLHNRNDQSTKKDCIVLIQESSGRTRVFRD